MRLLLFIGIVTLHAAMAFYFPDEAEESNPASSELPDYAGFHLASVTNGLSKFAGKFYQVVANDIESRSRVCSPISVSMVLSMLSLGARGNTKMQLARILELPNEDIVKNGFTSLNDRFNGYTEVTLRFANKIYLSNDTTEPNFAFTRVLKNSFNSDLEEVYFAEPQTSSNIINKWVENKTNKRIKDIIQPGDVDEDTALVIVNTVYFKGEWDRQFNKDDTLDRPFWVDGIKEENRSTMYSNSYYKYGELEEVNAHFVELPYKSIGANDKISMFIILPKEKNGLKTLEENFNKITVEKLKNANSDAREIRVYLPKFEITSEMSLEKSLRQLGLTDMFSPEADFTGIASGRPLRVSQIKQKAFIKIDEQGSESGAATTAPINGRLFSTDFVEFEAKYPFVGIIATTGNNPVNLFTFSYTGKE